MRIATAIACLFVVTACQKTEAPTEASVAEPAQAEAAAAEPAAAEGEPTATATAEGELHNVACACSLKEGEECSNMIEVSGKYVPLAGETGLEEMAFCGKEGLKAKAEGKIDGEKFVATSFELVSPAE